MSNQQTLEQRSADLILINGRIATQDDRRSFASAIALHEECFLEWVAH